MGIVKTYPNMEAVSEAAAKLFAEIACQAVKRQGRCNVVLAGGGTPRLMYELLAGQPYLNRIPWGQIHVYWGDERCVPGNHKDSNQLMARQSLLDHVPIPEDNVHPIVYGTSVSGAAEEYEKLLRETFSGVAPQFDLIFLGLGNDGHTASLFPGTDALNSQDQWVSPVYVADKNSYRVTLTAPILNQGTTVVFLVTGSAKAQVLKEVLDGPYDSTRLPAQLIKPVHGELYWILDHEVAALLNR